VSKAKNQHEAGIQQKRNLMGKPEGKRPLEIPRHKWVCNIKTNIRIGWYGLDSSGSK
jgi:hypothetical protein